MDYYYIGLDAHIKTSSFVVLDTLIIEGIQYEKLKDSSYEMS